MGIYFIAAGISSENRKRTLDKSWRVEDVCGVLPQDVCDRVCAFFPEGNGVYLWGANKSSVPDLEKVCEYEYVVDVKNKEIIQIFEFCFWFKSSDTRLQERVGWDEEKPRNERRPFNYIYFLRNPTKTRRMKKVYFQRAFGLEQNPQWLVRQLYFGDRQVREALNRSGAISIEDFLGITNANKSGNDHPQVFLDDSPVCAVDDNQVESSIVQEKLLDPPEWLLPIIHQIEVLRRDSDHLERDHEDLVANFFETLGYLRLADIKFQRGSIDIRIDDNNRPLVTIEVKADWALSSSSKSAIQQAYRYAVETGTPFVIITNGDCYCVYDRTKGLSIAENLIAEFQLTRLTESDLAIIIGMKKGVLGQYGSNKAI